MTINRKYAAEAAAALRNAGDDTQPAADRLEADFLDALTADTQLVPFGLTAFDPGAGFDLQPGWSPARTLGDASLDGFGGAVSTSPASSVAAGETQPAAPGIGSDASSSLDASQTSLPNSSASASSASGSASLAVTGTDFNGDGKADVLFQNAGGQVWQWQMNGSNIAASNGVGNPGAGWQVVGTGPSFGFGPSILLQNADGEVWRWDMSGSQITGSGEVGNPGASWHAVGTGDFANANLPGLVFQNDSGEVWGWVLNPDVGGVFDSNEIGNPGASWHVVGTGDFNHDGTTDILFQNDSGALWEWQMASGGVLQIGASASITSPGAGWHAVGTGDFTGDGFADDILFQNDSGAVGIEGIINGFQEAGFVTIGNPGQSWHAAETGDFNGDGKADILFRNDSGAIWEWQMNTSGSLHIGASSSVGNPGSNWSVA
jgi:uncharacterized protein (UPF0548 family)